MDSIEAEFQQPSTASELQQRLFLLPFTPSGVNLVSSTIGLVTVSLLSTFAIRQLVSLAWWRNVKSMQLLAQFYSDEDGEATTESVRVSSTRRIPWLAVFFATLGACVSGTQVWFSAWNWLDVPIEVLLQAAIWVRSRFTWVQSFARHPI